MLSDYIQVYLLCIHINIWYGYFTNHYELFFAISLTKIFLTYEFVNVCIVLLIVQKFKKKRKEIFWYFEMCKYCQLDYCSFINNKHFESKYFISKHAFNTFYKSFVSKLDGIQFEFGPHIKNISFLFFLFQGYDFVTYL